VERDLEDPFFKLFLALEEEIYLDNSLFLLALDFFKESALFQVDVFFTDLTLLEADLALEDFELVEDLLEDLALVEDFFEEDFTSVLSEEDFFVGGGRLFRRRFYFSFVIRLFTTRSRRILSGLGT